MRDSVATAGRRCSVNFPAGWRAARQAVPARLPAAPELAGEVSRERRHDPWRQHKILLIVVPMVLLLYASGITWERQEDARIEEEARIARFVASQPVVAAWLGDQAKVQIALSQPNPDLTDAPLRYWVTAESGRRRVQAVVDADRRVTPSPLTLACAERELTPVLRDKPPLRCGR